MKGLWQIELWCPTLRSYGTPCFEFARVPFKNLIHYLEGGHSLGGFLRQFPTVSREKAVQALEEAKESLFAKIT